MEATARGLPMTGKTAFLVNISREGRHTALTSTHDEQLVEDLAKAMQEIGYEVAITKVASPSADKTNGKA